MMCSLMFSETRNQDHIWPFVHLPLLFPLPSHATTHFLYLLESSCFKVIPVKVCVCAHTSICARACVSKRVRDAQACTCVFTCRKKQTNMINKASNSLHKSDISISSVLITVITNKRPTEEALTTPRAVCIHTHNKYKKQETSA